MYENLVKIHEMDFPQNRFCGNFHDTFLQTGQGNILSYITGL